VNDNAISIVVADKHPIFLHGLVSLLSSQSPSRVLAACGDGATALEAILNHAPNIALLDLRMTKMTGLDVLNEVSKRALATRVIILTAYIEDSEVALALSRGVYGILAKNSSPKILIQCVRIVHRGGRFFPRGLIQRLRQRQAEVHRLLTAREREVVRLVAQGLPNKSVAQQLQISGGTVKLHLHHIYSKTGTSSRTSLANLAFRFGLVQHPTEPRAAAIIEDQSPGSAHQGRLLSVSARGH
jgi:two-component system nitrate/nitrite response regulator NarL